VKIKKVFLGIAFSGICLATLSACNPNRITTTVEAMPVDTTTTTTQAKAVSYSLKVVDLDGEVLLDKNLNTTENTNLVKALENETKLVSSNTEFGTYLVSINDSIVDQNYFLSIYVNGTPASTGADGIIINDNDQIEIKNECWNTIESGYGTLDNTDLLVDKTIYKTYKEFKEIYKEASYIPYDALFAYSNFKNVGYSIDTKNLFTDTIKNNYKNIDYSTLTLSDTFKTAISLYALGSDVTAIKQYITNSSFDLSAPFTETYAAYTYDVMKLFNIQASNYNDYVNKINNINLAANETSCMCVPAIKLLNDEYDFSEFVNAIKGSLTENGFSYSMSYGGVDYVTCNASSTAQAIIALTTIGEDLKEDGFKVNNKNLIEILFNYYDEETKLFYDYENDSNNLIYAEPQALAALISYKILRDNGEVNIYRG